MKTLGAFLETDLADLVADFEGDMENGESTGKDENVERAERDKNVVKAENGGQ